jgi:hypothetical protein
MSLTSKPPPSSSAFDYAVNCTHLQQLKEMDRTLEQVFRALVGQKEVLLYGDHETGCALTLCFLLKYYNPPADTTTTTLLDTKTACRFLQWKSGLDTRLLQSNLPLVESYRGFLTKIENSQLNI